MGAAGARNLGVAEARGDWVAFQDSDDEWLPTKLEKQMARLLAPGAGFVGAYCGLLTLGGLDDRAGERLRLRYVPDPAIVPAEGDILTPLLFANMISTQTLVVRRDVILELGRFDEDTTPIEDWDFVIRLSRRGPIAFVDEPLVHQRFSPNSITRDTARRLTSRIRLVEKNLDAFAATPRSSPGSIGSSPTAAAPPATSPAPAAGSAGRCAWRRPTRAAGAGRCRPTALGLAPRGRAQASAPASSASK